jgi:DNA-binding NarL/FixJ family response regulator
MQNYILADNQDITRIGIISLLKKDDIESIVEVFNYTELRNQLNIYPESVIILDYTLFDFKSVEQMLNMKEGAKESSWVLFSDNLEESFLRQVLFLDKTISVVMKQDKKEDIAFAIKLASQKNSYLCELAESILEQNKPVTQKPDILTATEKIILREIALGKMTKEIAWEKNLSFHTVNTHRRNIFRKLEVNNVHEAIKYALKSGLIDFMEYYI